MSDQQEKANDFPEADLKRNSKKRKSKKKKQRKGISDIDFGNGVTAADASKVAMEVDSNGHGTEQQQHQDHVVPDIAPDRTSDDGSPATKVIRTVQEGDDGEVVEITQTTTVKREGGSTREDEDTSLVEDLPEGESTVLIDVENEGNTHTETTTVLDSGPVTVENYEEQLDDNTTVQVEHTSQTLTTTKTIIITEDGREVEVDADDPNVEYIEEEPEIITEEITQTIRRRRIVTKTPDGREIETFEDVVVSDEDADVDGETTTVIVTHDDDAPLVPDQQLPTCHVTIGTTLDHHDDDSPAHANDDVNRIPAQEHVTVIDRHVTKPSVEEENVQMFVENQVESEVSIEDILGPAVPSNENVDNHQRPSEVSLTHAEADVESSDDEPAVHIAMPPRDQIEEETIGYEKFKGRPDSPISSSGDHDERPRSTSQRSAKYIIAAPPRNERPVVRDTVKIYIRAEESTPDDDDAHDDSTKTRHVVKAKPTAPCKEELIEKHAVGSRDGIDEWVLVNFKQDEVVAFIELLKNLPFSFDVSTEVPQQQCTCW